MTTMATLARRVAKLEHEVRQLKIDPDAIATPADIKAIESLHRAEKAGTLVDFDRR